MQEVQIDVQDLLARLGIDSPTMLKSAGLACSFVGFRPGLGILRGAEASWRLCTHKLSGNAWRLPFRFWVCLGAIAQVPREAQPATFSF